MSCHYGKQPDYTDSRLYALHQATAFLHALPQTRTGQQRWAVFGHYCSSVVLDYALTAWFAPKTWQCH